jgi:hypothetical protein
MTKMIVSSRKPVPKAPELISIPLGRKTKNTRVMEIPPETLQQKLSIST